MASKAERDRRKALVGEIAEQSAGSGIANAPKQGRPGGSIDHLDQALVKGCDHSLRITRAFLASRSLAESTSSWLR